MTPPTTSPGSRAPRDSGERRNRRAQVMILGLLLLPGSAATAAEIIDRIVAVVAGRVVMLSDVRAALELGLVARRDSGDPVGLALDQLVDRELILAEVRRYVPAEPPEAELESRLLAVRASLGSDEEYRSILTATGMTEQRLEEFIRDDLRIAAYLEQRFTSAAQPTDEDVSRYYREHLGEFVADGRQQPLDAVAGSIRARLAAIERLALIEAWVSELRRRSDVRLLYRSPSP